MSKEEHGGKWGELKRERDRIGRRTEKDMGIKYKIKSKKERSNGGWRKMS